MTQPTIHGPIPVHLGLAEPDPQPVEGCDVCAALDKQRTAARVEGDGAKASDCNVEIRRHQDQHGAQS